MNGRGRMERRWRDGGEEVEGGWGGGRGIEGRVCYPSGQPATPCSCTCITATNPSASAAKTVPSSVAARSRMESFNFTDHSSFLSR